LIGALDPDQQPHDESDLPPEKGEQSMGIVEKTEQSSAGDQYTQQNKNEIEGSLAFPHRRSP
jgi:hypothetical protein